MKLNPKALGFTLAIILGGFWFIAMGFSLMTGIGQNTIKILGGLHPFFHYTLSGLLMITIQHVIAGFIIGWISGRIYNKFI